MKFPDISRLGSVSVPDAGHFILLLVREDLTPGEAAGVLRGKVARAKYPLDAYDAGIEDVIDATRAATREPLDVERLADVVTALHLRWDKACSESHMADALWFAAEYARLTQPATEPEDGA